MAQQVKDVSFVALSKQNQEKLANDWKGIHKLSFTFLRYFIKKVIFRTQILESWIHWTNFPPLGPCCFAASHWFSREKLKVYKTRINCDQIHPNTYLTLLQLGKRYIQKLVSKWFYHKITKLGVGHLSQVITDFF